MRAYPRLDYLAGSGWLRAFRAVVTAAVPYPHASDVTFLSLQYSPEVLGSPVDLGGAYIGGGQNRILRVADSVGVKAYRVYHDGSELMQARDVLCYPWICSLGALCLFDFHLAVLFLCIFGSFVNAAPCLQFLNHTIAFAPRISHVIVK